MAHKALFLQLRDAVSGSSIGPSSGTMNIEHEAQIDDIERLEAEIVEIVRNGNSLGLRLKKAGSRMHRDLAGPRSW